MRLVEICLGGEVFLSWFVDEDIAVHERLYRLKTSSFALLLSVAVIGSFGEVGGSLSSDCLPDGSWEAVFAPSQNRTISAETARWYCLNEFKSTSAPLILP